jgi:hypothetical protein
MNMRRLFSVASLMAAFVAGADHATAQVPTTVQLPTFHFFSVDTTVLVPDRGATYLGGVNYSSAGRTSRGIPGLGGPLTTNTAFGRSTGGGNVWVSAYIHDLEAMDAAILGYGNQTAGNLVRLPSSVAASATQPNPSFAQSIASLKAQAVSEDQAKQLEAEAYLKRAQEKLKEGKAGLAKIYFQMAERRSTGAVKEQALAGLRSIERNKAVQAVAKQ